MGSCETTDNSEGVGFESSGHLEGRDDLMKDNADFIMGTVGC